MIKTADEITDEWLGSVLGADGLELIGVEAIGTGQMSRVYRASYRRPGGEPESVAVKLAATDQNSRDVGVNLGAYLREVTFYRELRDRIGGDGTLAKCHLAAHDPKEGWFTLVLEDVDDGVQGDQIAGCGPDEARIAMVALARIHAPVFGDLALAATDWLNQPNPLNQALLAALLPGFLERYGDRDRPRARRGLPSASSHPRTPGTQTGARRLASSTATTGSTTCSSTTGPARSSTGRRWASAR